MFWLHLRLITEAILLCCFGQGLLRVLQPLVNYVAFQAMVRQDRGFDPNLVDLFSCRFLRNDRDEFSRLPLNFKPLHFIHRFSCSTVYSSGSLSNLEPGTSSSSVKTVKDRSELLDIHMFFPTSLTEFDFVCLSLDGVWNLLTSLVHSAILSPTAVHQYMYHGSNITQ